jgi:arylsulfatase A-like enzyme
VQLVHGGWDHHGGTGDQNLLTGLPDRARQVDQGAAALVLDLKQRGLLDSTLVVFAGEFGRTPMLQGPRSTKELGRDHLRTAFTIWLAGGGTKRGLHLGKTDDFGMFGIEDKVHVHDLQATILHLLGIDHEKLTFKFQGRDFRLTDVRGNVVRKLLA